MWDKEGSKEDKAPVERKRGGKKVEESRAGSKTRTEQREDGGWSATSAARLGQRTKLQGL